MSIHRHHNDGDRGFRQPGLARVVGVCVVTVLILFGSYEVVERLWLTGVEPRTIYFLHLLRGLSAAAIAATVVVILYLRAGSAPVNLRDVQESKSSLRKMLQRVSLRTKIVVPIVALAVVPVVLVGAFTISHTRDSLRASVAERVEFDTVSKAESISEYFETIRQDVLFLSELKTIRDLAGAAAESYEQINRLRGEAQRDLLAFTRGKRAYYQVRYLDASGREVVRLNLAAGIPQVVPAEQLQDKSARPYVTDTLELEPGVVFVSEMESNFEHGRMETPLRAVVRCATRVLDNEGHSRGIVIINIFADFISSLAGPFPPSTEAWLVADDGAYLAYLGESKDRRDAFRFDKQRYVSDDYGEELVAAVLSDEDHHLTRWTANSLVTSSVIHLSDGAPDRRWILLVAHARGPVEAPIQYLTAVLATATLLFAAVAGVIGVFIAHYVTEPVARLRRATREIAAGDLSKRLEISTGDEIEALADDFNTMTDRLREAQERLSSWNTTLEQEVAEQSDRLHRLQTGLARSDKLASLGQMAAGVMHEIGNPLAAIKTRIQVSQEDKSDDDDDDRQLLTDVPSKVDRLAAFLRPFSRLTRLGEATIRPMSVTEVVKGVIVLITPELRRRGLTLHVDMPPSIPLVAGDADQFRQLLINLLLNAADASPTGGKIKVRVRCDHASEGEVPARGEVTIDVIDRGVGMPPEALQKIGTPFFTTKPEGTGLGLAIVRQIVREHNGELRIQSEIGEGTIVTVCIPIPSTELLEHEEGVPDTSNRSPELE